MKNIRKLKVERTIQIKKIRELTKFLSFDERNKVIEFIKKLKESR